MPRVRTLRYVVIGVVAFSLGAVMTVQAVAPSGILGTVQLADRTNATQLAAVDSSGNLQVKVTSAASQAVTGTVSVSNFPATQPVSGTVKTTPSVATAHVRKDLAPEAEESENTTFTSINASFIQVSAIGGDIEVTISGSLGEVFYDIMGDDEVRLMPLTQQIPVNAISTHCTNFVLRCRVVINIFGD